MARAPTLAELGEARRRLDAGWSWDPAKGWKRPPGASSHELSAQEVRAVKRIWPGTQLEFKLERHSGK